MLILVVAVFAPVVAPHDPGTSGTLDITRRLRPPLGWGGEHGYLLGTDALGRDILSRILYGARVSLAVGALAVLLSGGLGVTLGLVAGYWKGWADDAIMRAGDIQLAFPFVLLAIAVMAVLGPSLVNLVLVLAIGSWVTYARMVRSQVLEIREREFVLAARALGIATPRLLLRHVLPSATAPIIVVASYSAANVILTEALLSFLGLGVDPTVPAWGSMVAEGRDYIRDAWWLTAFPGLAIALTVLSINIVGDWLRDYMDPRLRV
ncbi:MAG: ABC transporter permease [Planctomycetes bacterium]|nr:ABC transporter permease [Planctomycetota bacterium]